MPPHRLPNSLLRLINMPEPSWAWCCNPKVCFSWFALFPNLDFELLMGLFLGLWVYPRASWIIYGFFFFFFVFCILVSWWVLIRFLSVRVQPISWWVLIRFLSAKIRFCLFFVIFICGFFSLYGLLLFAFEIVKISDFFTKLNDKTSLIFGCVYKFLSNSNIIMLLSLLF